MALEVLPEARRGDPAPRACPVPRRLRRRSAWFPCAPSPPWRPLRPIPDAVHGVVGRLLRLASGILRRAHRLLRLDLFAVFLAIVVEVNNDGHVFHVSR